jgi:hypothetical protein
MPGQREVRTDEAKASSMVRKQLNAGDGSLVQEVTW